MRTKIIEIENKLARALIHIKRDFTPIQSNNFNKSKFKFFGLIRKGYERFNLNQIFNEQEVEGHTERNGWKMGDYYIKILGDKELDFTPAIRFNNSLSMYQPNKNCEVPEPIGLVYSGEAYDLIKRESRGYFISKYRPGERLLHILNELTKEEKRKIFGLMKINLDYFREIGIYPLDFAPRDIIVRNKKRMTIVDTEHVKYAENHIIERTNKGGSYNFFACRNDSEIIRHLVKKQRSQFREDYKDFLQPSELEKNVKYIFPLK